MDEDGVAGETTVGAEDGTDRAATAPGDADGRGPDPPRATSLVEARERYLADDTAYDERAYDRDLERLASGVDDLDQVVDDDAAGSAWAALAGRAPTDEGTDDGSTADTRAADGLTTGHAPAGASLVRVGLVSSAALLWALQTVFVPTALCVFVYALTTSVALGVTVGLLWLVGSVVFSVSLALTLADGAGPWTDAPTA